MGDSNWLGFLQYNHFLNWLYSSFNKVSHLFSLCKLVSCLLLVVPSGNSSITLSPSENVAPSAARFQVISGMGSPSASQMSVTWPFSDVVSFWSCNICGCTVKIVHIIQLILDPKGYYSQWKFHIRSNYILKWYEMTNSTAVTTYFLKIPKKCK